MANLSQLTLPVKDATTGEVTNQTFDLPSGGSGATPETYIGTCSSDATDQNKVATVPSGFSLSKGVRIGIKFANTNTYSATAEEPITLNVNGTGAKSIYYNNTADLTGTNTTAFGYANRYTYYVYDGTYWVFDGSSLDNNTTYSPQSLGMGYGTCSTAYATTAKVASLAGYNLIKNGIVAVRFTNAVNAGATLNINSKGAKAIYYRGSAITDKVINIGDIATFVYDGSHYNLIACDNIFKAYVTVHGDPNKTVTVTNSAIGLSDTLVLNSSGFGTYYCNQPGTYVFTQ